jgi:hypothetical protein
MKIEDYTPTELRRPFIKAYKIIESQEEMTNRVVPGTSSTIAFRLKGQISYTSITHKANLPTAVFSGLRKSVRIINYAADTAALNIPGCETNTRSGKPKLKQIFFQYFGD